ncbi:MAG TPA: STAS domain-containing protein [Steroidobacteraceae bacterium]
MSTASQSAPDVRASGGFELIERSSGQFEARGALTFATARRGRELARAAFQATAAREIHVNCSGITASDSAGMSVLLDWLALAKRSGRALRFDSLPRQVQAIARISDVLELLQQGV